MTLLEEGILTHGALERALVQMVHFMILELTGSEERLVAELATIVENIFGLVNAFLVKLQVDQLIEALAANLTLVGCLLTVNEHVTTQELLLQKIFPTQLTHELLHPDVVPHVPLELVFDVEGLVTVFTLKVPGSAFVTLEVSIQVMFTTEFFRTQMTLK
jgi:hypothetical protein